MTIKVFLQKISSCTAKYYLGFKNPVFKAQGHFLKIFVKNCKNSKFFESQHAALVPLQRFFRSYPCKNFQEKHQFNQFQGKRKP